MTAQTATLIAACIAALASIIALIVNLSEQRQSELRAAHRHTLDRFIADLAESLHEAVASASILLKTKSKDASARWRERGGHASERLKSLRTQLRYPLWGVDEGLRVLSRVPDWADHFRQDDDQGRKLIKAATHLRKALDYAIRQSYRKGRTPTSYERLRVRYAAYKCRSAFANSKSESSSDEDVI